MTKAEVVEVFKSEYLPIVKQTYEQDGEPDYVARSEEWNNFTDFLCTDRQITPHQYSTWTHPRCCGV